MNSSVVVLLLLLSSVVMDWLLLLLLVFIFIIPRKTIIAHLHFSAIFLDAHDEQKQQVKLTRFTQKT
jgi:hypothetical protein